MQSGKDSNALSQLATPLGTISSIIEEVMSQETCVLRNFFFLGNLQHVTLLCPCNTFVLQHKPKKKKTNLEESGKK